MSELYVKGISKRAKRLARAELDPQMRFAYRG